MDESVFCYAGEYSGAAPVAFHCHPAAELVFQAEGTCVHGLEDGREFVAPPGAVFAVPAGAPHRQFSRGEARTVYIVGDTPFPAPRLFPATGEPFVATCFRVILDVWQSGRPGHRVIIDGLRATLSRWLAEASAISTQEENNAVVSPAVRRARGFIDANFRGPVVMEKMARACGLSHSYLTAEFRRVFGETPQRYLARKRLALAARLLLDPRRPIKEIAICCGFSGTNYFTRSFHAAYRMTPSEYRAAHADGADSDDGRGAPPV